VKRRGMAARLCALAGMLLVSAAVAGPGSASRAGSPFYVVPTSKAPTTQECQNLAYCYGVRGPWVLVPAHGEASFLFACPERSAELGAYLLGGTDALASSSHVHVWYDGWLGAPFGSQTQHSTAGLLFHAESDNGQPGAFEPVLGCIDLLQSSKLSTIAAHIPAPPPAGVRTAAPPLLHSTLVVLEPGWQRLITMSCPHSQPLVGSWSAAAFGTEGPPVFPRANPVTMVTSEHGQTVAANVRTGSWVPYLIRVQVGVMCET
jgi:hypothetical protein